MYAFADYRRYLAAYYDYAKAEQYGFSFRVFSRRAGIRSSNYLRLVIDGERNLTRAATVLGVAQPALSKTLAKLRRYFADPLFVRAGHRMEPTAKALELADAVHALLDDVTMLRARHKPFDAATIQLVVQRALETRGLKRHVHHLRQEIGRKHLWVRGSDPAMAHVAETVERVAHRLRVGPTTGRRDAARLARGAVLVARAGG